VSGHFVSFFFVYYFVSKTLSVRANFLLLPIEFTLLLKLIDSTTELPVQDPQFVIQ